MDNVSEGMRATVPKIASQTPGLTTTRIAWASEASVVAIDMEKMENRRKRSARMWTPRMT